MDIFADVVQENHGLLLNSAVRAASDLGVFRLYRDAPPRSSYAPAEMASRLGLPARRLRRLLDILVAESILVRGPDREPFRLQLPEEPSPIPGPAGHWDHIADVISRDRPLDLDPAWLEGHLTYVAAKSAQAAPILWRRLEPRAGSHLLDIGGGLGAFSFSFLDRHPANSATLFDLPEVLNLIESRRSVLPSALRLVAGDALEARFESGHEIVLLANVLHLFGEEDCRTIVRNAVSAVASGGMAVLWDLAISPDRTGPLASLYFALNMALFTEAGDVHTAGEMMSWMSEAGLEDITELAVPECQHSLCLVGTRRKA